MGEESSFRSLMQRVATGDDDAANRIFHDYEQRLVALAQSKLNQMLQQKVGAEDIFQSVMRTFFNRHKHGQFELQNSQGLWALLAQITVWKCSKAAKHFGSQKRDAGMEVNAGATASSLDMDYVSREPSPDEAMELAELVEQVLKALELPHQREIVTLALQGFPVEEISTKVRYTKRTVERTLKQVREFLERQLKENRDD